MSSPLIHAQLFKTKLFLGTISSCKISHLKSKILTAVIPLPNIKKGLASQLSTKMEKYYQFTNISSHSNSTWHLKNPGYLNLGGRLHLLSKLFQKQINFGEIFSTKKETKFNRTRYFWSFLFSFLLMGQFPILCTPISPIIF